MSRYVLLSKFCELTGYTEKAVRRKIESGVWIRDVHFVREGDTLIKMDMEAYELWAEGVQASVIQALKREARRSVLALCGEGVASAKR